MESFLLDLRFAFRILAKRPWFALASVLTLAVGIGANTAVFSVAESVLLRSLPFPEPERLVQVQRTIDGHPAPNLAPAQYRYWREAATPFEHITAYTFVPLGMNYSGGDRPEHVRSRKVTADFFRTFGVEPILGRDFSPEEDVPGGPLSVVLSHEFWQQSFGGDQNIIGRSLRLDDKPYTVVGVMPSTFRFPRGTEIWTLLQLEPASEDRQAILTVTARLAPGKTVEQATATLAGPNQEYVDTHYTPQDAVQYDLLIRPLNEHLYGSLKALFRLLTFSALIVLLVACANVTNLQLMHLSARRQEIAVRLAIGSSPKRLMRQMISESLVLAALGGIVGLGFCRLSVDLLLNILPAQTERFHPVEIDGVVLLFTLATLLLISIIVGLIPALRALQIPIVSNLRENGRTGAGRGGSRWRLALVSAEIALTVAALIVALQLGQSFLRLIEVDPGFQQRGRHVAELPLSQAHGSGPGWQRLADELVPNLETLPEIRRAALTTGLPLHLIPDFDFLIAGRDPSVDGVGRARYRAVSPGYFETFGIPLLYGETIDSSQRHDSAWVAVVNQAAAERYWPGEDPIGERITIGPPTQPSLADPEPRTIVGVVSNVRENGLPEPDAPAVYVPISQVPDPMAERMSAVLPMALVTETGRGIGPPGGALGRRMEEAVARFDADLPLVDLMPMERLVRQTIESRRSVLRLVGLFAGLALILSVVGIYGVMASLVLQRIRELVVRMVFGAPKTEVAFLILRQGAAAVVAGLLAGLFLGWSLSRLIGSSLSNFGAAQAISPYFLAPAALVVCSAAAVLIPAYRATRIRVSAITRLE